MVKDKVLKNIIMNMSSGCSIKQLTKKTKFCQLTIYSAIKKMQSQGLLIIEDGWNNTIYLTPSGEEVKQELLNKYLKYDYYVQNNNIGYLLV